MTLAVFEILVPLVDDTSQNPHPRELFLALEEELVSRFGGYTDKGLVQGAWRDDQGKTVRDVSRCYLLAVPRELTATIRAFTSGIGKLFGQRVMYLGQVGEAELVAA